MGFMNNKPSQSLEKALELHGSAGLETAQISHLLQVPESEVVFWIQTFALPANGQNGDWRVAANNLAIFLQEREEPVETPIS